MHRTAKFAIHLCVALCCLASAHLFAQDDNPSAPTPEEKQILDLTNDVRADQNLGPLKWDPALAAAAAKHNQLMHDQGELSHQYPGEPVLTDRAAQAGAHFSSIAENIAVGPNPGAIEREWLHSAPHRANIFDPRMDSIGISILRRGSDLYATEDFAHAVASADPGQVEAQVAALLQKQNLNVSKDDKFIRDARESCEMNTGSAGGTQPRFIMRWESSNMNQLPDQITQQIATGTFKSAAVGTYRVAVLLY
jgi:hypothetical protein